MTSILNAIATSYKSFSTITRGRCILDGCTFHDWCHQCKESSAFVYGFPKRTMFGLMLTHAPSLLRWAFIIHHMWLAKWIAMLLELTHPPIIEPCSFGKKTYTKMAPLTEVSNLYLQGDVEITKTKFPVIRYSVKNIHLPPIWIFELCHSSASFTLHMHYTGYNPRSTRSGHWFATYWHWFHTSECRSVEECDISFTPYRVTWKRCKRSVHCNGKRPI